MDRIKVLSVLRNFLSARYPEYFYFRSYSQWGEDAVISQFLHTRLGSYIDIGSGHPIKGNNTFFLYQRGWQGLLVDPIESNFKLSKKYRRKDIVLKNLVSKKKGKIPFWEFSNYGLSTTKKSRAEKLIKSGHKLLNTYNLESITLESIIDRFYNDKDNLPKLLSIDVEEAELSVLESNNWETFRPKVICIEVLNENILDSSPVHKFLYDRNYILRASVGNSQIFVLID